MSFSSLPPELVHQLIESTVPHTFHSTTYEERQRTLCRLSLVSRLFRSIAQPLLFEIVKLGGLEDAKKLPTARAVGGSDRTFGVLRWAILKRDYGDDLDPTQEEQDRVLESLGVFETTRNLTLSYLEERILSQFMSMSSSHLTDLHLSSSRFEPLNTISLPSLHSLTLYDASFELFRSLVDPSIVPSLRNIALMDCTEDSVQWLQKPSISRFLLQLETIYFDSSTWSELDERFR